ELERDHAHFDSTCHRTVHGMYASGRGRYGRTNANERLALTRIRRIELHIDPPSPEPIGDYRIDFVGLIHPCHAQDQVNGGQNSQYQASNARRYRRHWLPPGGEKLSLDRVSPSATVDSIGRGCEPSDR